MRPPVAVEPPALAPEADAAPESSPVPEEASFRVLRGLRRGLARLVPLAWALSVALLCAVVFRDRQPIVSQNHDVGHADEAAYALQARGLVLEGSCRVPYVSVFFRRYDPGIWRYDDHWPPLLGWVLAPFFRWKGVDAAVGRSVCVGLGALILPMVAGLLAGATTKRGWAAFAVAGVMLADTLIFQESLRMLSDVLMLSLLAGYAAAVVAGRRNSRWFWVAGACAAGATLAKGSQVLLLGMLPAGAILVSGFGVLRERRLWGGLVVGLLLLTPWWLTMYMNYGSALHSTQNSVSAFYGMGEDWDRSFYRVYWDGEPPSLKDRFQDLEKWGEVSRRNAEVFLRSALLGEEAGRRDWNSLGRFGDWVRRALLKDGSAASRTAEAGPAPARPWRTILHAVALGWGGVTLVLWPMVWLVQRGLRGRRLRREIVLPGEIVWDTDEDRRPCFVLGASAFLASLVLLQAGFVIFLWSAEQIRFTLVLTPLLAVLGVGAAAALLDWVCSAVRWIGARVATRLQLSVKLGRWGDGMVHLVGLIPALVSLALAVLAAVWAVRWHTPLLEWQLAHTDVRVPEGPRYPRYHAVAESLAAAGIGAEAVVMTRNPWELLFYTPPGMRGVGLPYAEPEEILEVAKYYGVTHFVYDCERPGLRRFIRRRQDVFRQVVQQPFSVYVIHWEAVQ